MFDATGLNDFKKIGNTFVGGGLGDIFPNPNI